MSNRKSSIQFYKSRNWSQSLMTAIDFYQQHIKIIYGNILRLGAPFAAIIVVVMSLISDSREDFTSSYFLEPTTSTMLVAWVLILSLISVTFVILVYLLRLYDEGLINESGKLQLMEKMKLSSQFL